MRSVVDIGWGIYFFIAAKCGEVLVAEPSRLLALGVAVLAASLVAALLHWSFSGGPSWGRYWWSKLGRPWCSPAEMIPGPRGLPFIGSMGLMSGLAHRKLSMAATAHGARRLMAFSLGETRVVVTCDPDVAKEILCSSYFADRPVKESAYELMFDRAIGFAPYGPYWRALRRIATTHLFCPKQNAASAHQRADIATQMVGALVRVAKEGRHVRVRDILKRASLCNIMSSVFGKRYDLQRENDEVTELRSLVDEGYDLLGKLNWSDHLPALAGLDLQRIRSRSVRLVPRVQLFVNQIIKEHRARRELGSHATSDFVDVLLSLQGADKLSDSNMVAILWEMVFRGTDTVAVLIEWVLARLVLHSDVQAKVHEELDDVVGFHREVAESDTKSLVYHHAVVKETLRMHPPGPLLSWARMATSDVVVDGKLVPSGTTAMVNMWAITHDPSVWPDPLEFNPDRFVGPDNSTAKMSLLGLDLRLAPFGSGRRSCPGKLLAMSTVVFWVASLMHEFDWRPAARKMGVDLSEVLRLSCEMAAPLTVELCRRRRLDEELNNSVV